MVGAPIQVRYDPADPHGRLEDVAGVRGKLQLLQPVGRNSQAHAYCTVNSGQIRLAAQCSWAPWAYSGWVGRGSYQLTTGQCWFGVGSISVETR